MRTLFLLGLMVAFSNSAHALSATCTVAEVFGQPQKTYQVTVGEEKPVRQALRTTNGVGRELTLSILEFNEIDDITDTNVGRGYMVMATLIMGEREYYFSSFTKDLNALLTVSDENLKNDFEAAHTIIHCKP